MKRALITGVSGQDGSYLAEWLLQRGYRVVGTMQRGAPERPPWFESLAPRIEIRELDVREAGAVDALLHASPVDEVYHLAAQSRVGASWDDPRGTAEVTAMGTLHLLEAVRAMSPNVRPRLLVAGSCEVYGRSVCVPQDEHTPHTPISPYGVAKSFAQRMTALYRERYGLHAATAVLFNHESPRRAPPFVSRKITRAAVRIARGEASELRLGNVDVVRDWGYAGDFVDAMWRMQQMDAAEDLVIATGEGHTVRHFAELALGALGLDPAVYLVVDQSLVRPDDAPALVGDPARARSRLGWTRTVDFGALVRLLMAAEQNLNS